MSKETEKKATEEVKTQPKTKSSQENKEDKVGTILYNARTKKRMDIETVAQKLHIKSSYLTAIEESDYAKIPEFPYGIGFVRSYAKFLNLDSVRMSELFKAETSTTIESNKEPLQPVEEDPEHETSIPNGKYIIISLVMIALCYCLWALFSSS